jgi:hypothetical protein
MKTRINQLRIGLCLALFVLLTGWVVTRLRAADVPAPAPKQTTCAWQYQTFDVPTVDIDRRMNELGNAGWEIVSASRYSDANGIPMVFVTAKLLKSAGTVQSSSPPSQTAMRNLCIYNLYQLNAAIQQFALEHKKAASDPVTLDDLKPYLKIAAICPAGGTSLEDSYKVMDCQSAPTCIAPDGGTSHGHALPP